MEHHGLGIRPRCVNRTGHLVRIFGLRQAADDIAFLRCLGIVMRRHHHTQRGAAIPIGFDAIERPGHRVFKNAEQVTLQAQHDRLRFRVAHAAIEFERPGVPRSVNHQARIQKTGEGNAILCHPLHRRQDDVAHHFGVDLRRDDGCGRIRAHAAGVRALIGIAQTFVILAGCQRQHVLAVDHDDEARLFAGQKFFDHHSGASLGVRDCHFVVEQHHVDGSMRFRCGHRNHHALARSQAVSLDDNRRALLVNVSMRSGGVAECLIRRCRNPVPLHKGLGEILRAFELCGFLRGAKNLQPARAEHIDDARRQRRFRPDHGEVNMLITRKIRQRVNIGDRQIFQIRFQSGAAIAWRHIHHLHAL